MSLGLAIHTFWVPCPLTKRRYKAAKAYTLALKSIIKGIHIEQLVNSDGRGAKGGIRVSVGEHGMRHLRSDLRYLKRL